MAKKKKRTFRFNRIKVFVLVGVLAYAVLTFFNQQNMLTVQQTKQEQLLNEQEELNKQIEYYKNELNYIGSDEYIEKEARDRLGWLKPGEKKYVEAENGASPSPSPGADASASADPSAGAEASPAPSPSAQP